MKTKLLLITTIVSTLILLAFISEVEEIQIGTQIWAKKNLDVSVFRNGDIIPKIETKEEWEIAYNKHIPAWCYINNDPKMGIKFGKLYNYYAVNDARGLAPKGWHVPSIDEWSVLEKYLAKGIQITNESRVSQKLKSNEGWNDKGTNESGFEALPGGDCDVHMSFGSIGYVATWWSSTTYYLDGRQKSNDNTIDNAYSFSISYNNWEPRKEANWKGYGFSVRCLKGEELNNSETSNKGKIGIKILDIDSKLISDKNLKQDAKGVYVNDVSDGGAGSEAGIKVGDLITKIDKTGEEEINSTSNFIEKMGHFHPNDLVILTVIRNGEKLFLVVFLK